MIREEREVVIQFSLIPMDVQMPSTVGEREEDYHAGDITREGLEELRHKSFLSDSVFNIGMRHGTNMAEYLARMITGDRELRIEKVLTQYGIENLGHSVRMDALAVDSKGRMIDFEMQMERGKGKGRRMRVYESSFNLAFLAKGSPYSCLPSFTMIWLYGEDPHGRGRAVYTSQWKDQDNMVTDESVVRHEVNTRYSGEDEMGRMMYNIRCEEYDEMNDDPLKETMDYIKNTKEGMMEYTSDYARWKREGEEKGRAEGREEGRESTIETLLRDKLVSPEQIAKSFNMSLSEVYRIAESINY